MNRILMKQKLSKNLLTAKQCVKDHPKAAATTALLGIGVAVLTVALKHRAAKNGLKHTPVSAH